MLPILVLLAACSSFAAAGVVQIKPVSSNNPSYNENSLIGRVIRSFDISGDVNVNELYLGAIQRDLSSQGGNQAATNGHAVAVLGELSVGRPGDSCAAANYVNAYTRYVASGNSAGVREALGNYIQVVIGNIDNMVKLKTNRDSARYSSGTRGGCSGEGRTYQFEAAWDIILGSSAPNRQSLIGEEYCVAKRLYCAFNAISNNVAAQATAALLPPSVQVFEQSSGALSSFLTSLANEGNIVQSASSLKQALSSAVGRVSL